VIHVADERKQRETLSLPRVFDDGGPSPISFGGNMGRDPSNTGLNLANEDEFMDDEEIMGDLSFELESEPGLLAESADVMTIDTRSVPNDFSSMGIGAATLHSIGRRGYTKPKALQAQSFPLIATGKDLVIQSRSGTGKATSLALPLVERCDPRTKQVQGMIITATRDAALHLFKEVARLGFSRAISAVTVVPGQADSTTVNKLQAGSQIVIGTPDLIELHLARGTIDTERLSTLVLYEAEQLTGKRSIDALEGIIGTIQTRPQTMLFSNDIDEKVVGMLKGYLKDPIYLVEDAQGVVGSGGEMEHISYRMEGSSKIPTIDRLLRAPEVKTALVFVSSRRASEWLAGILIERGYNTRIFTGKPWFDNDWKASGGDKEVVVALEKTPEDVDMDTISVTINFDIPEDPRSYVQRMMRRPRRGMTGKVINLYKHGEEPVLSRIQRFTKITIKDQFMDTGYGDRDGRRGGRDDRRGGRSDRGRERGPRVEDVPGGRLKTGKPRKDTPGRERPKKREDREGPKAGPKKGGPRKGDKKEAPKKDVPVERPAETPKTEEKQE